jgi:hypothetical protein
MIPLTLPAEERRLYVRSFWITLTALAALPWLALSVWTQSVLMAAIGLALAAIAGLVIVVREKVVWTLYRHWNYRLVRPVSRLIARLVTATCFFVIFVAVGKTSAARIVQQGRPLAWTPRATLPPDAYGAMFAGVTSGSSSGPWVVDYLSWAWRSGNLWCVSLLPFLMVLRLLPRKQTTATPANVYTLF